MRIPFPPPPADALSSTGKPIFLEIFIASLEFFTGAVCPGITFNLSFIAKFLDSILSPIFFIAFGFGPINFIFVF